MCWRTDGLSASSRGSRLGLACDQKERATHLTTSTAPLRSIHPLRLERLYHRVSDLAPLPPAGLGTLDALLTPVHADLEDEAMRRVRDEHVGGVDAHLRFDSPDLADPTFAAAEYWFVADPLGGLQRLKLRDWPGASRRRPSSTSVDDASSFPRKARPWSQLEPAIQAVNERLAARSAGGSREQGSRQ